MSTIRYHINNVAFSLLILYYYYIISQVMKPNYHPLQFIRRVVQSGVSYIIYPI